jgi:hypothetical protein
MPALNQMVIDRAETPWLLLKTMLITTLGNSILPTPLPLCALCARQRDLLLGSSREGRAARRHLSSFTLDGLFPLAG